jgi:methylated-DNA-[protein]-cysteine S-methyltransferase
MTIELARVASPIGTLTIAVRDGRACAVDFAGRWERRRHALERRFGRVDVEPADDPAGVATALRAYFAGDVAALDRISVDPGGTAFQQRVWTALRAIAAGGTASYADVARAIGRPTAVRAVGAANGANPVALLIPCHRVVGADGGLTGYAGGLERKRWLLAHEAGRAA